MDVNQTVKINSLVNEFKKHGIATDEEAINQATKVVNGSSIDDSGEVSQPTLDMMNRKVSYLSDLTDRRIKDEVAKLRAELNNVVAELRALKDSVRMLQTRPAVQEKKIEETPETKEEKPKPRTGDFEPSDVDINKMFYCGNK